MIFFNLDSGVLLGAVFHPEAIGPRPESEPVDNEPKRKKRNSNMNDADKHREINEWKKAVQESLSPVFSVYDAWLFKHPHAAPSFTVPPPITCLYTDWAGLFKRRFEFWPKLQMTPDSPAEALFGRLHSNSTSAPLNATVSFDSPALNRIEVDLPPRSRFLMTHGVQTLAPLLEGAQERNQGFGVVVADPPWENASVRRGGGGYRTLPAGELCKLPCRELVGKCGLMLLWVTNRPRILQFIHEVLLERWGLKLVRTWYWIKTDRSGRPVIPLDCLHRHCYEPLLILAPINQDASLQLSMLKIPPDGFAFFDQAREHSRKPFLGPLIKQLSEKGLFPQSLASHEQQLELFARELHKDWTSWGNEVLKFQERSSPNGCSQQPSIESLSSLL